MRDRRRVVQVSRYIMWSITIILVVVGIFRDREYRDELKRDYTRVVTYAPGDDVSGLESLTRQDIKDFKYYIRGDMITFNLRRDVQANAGAYNIVKHESVGDGETVEDIATTQDYDSVIISRAGDTLKDIDTNSMVYHLYENNKYTGGTGYLIFVVIMLMSSIALSYMYREMSKPAIDGLDYKDGELSIVESDAGGVSLSDIKGHDEILDEVVGVIDIMRRPDEYKERGVELPRGILLFGPPGTGKTTMAKAIANDAGVGFLYASGSEFVEKYVGVGASRVRSLFKRARREAPCVVFIDEIDAIGGSRGNDNSGERDSTLNQILTEMDGFDGSEGIFVLGGTNRIDTLDSALLRSGRFDSKIYLGLPDQNGRLELLEHFSSDKVLSSEVDLLEISEHTAGMSGADIRNLMNQAALLSVRSGCSEINHEHLNEALYTILVNGKPKEDYMRCDREATLIAYHEAGHALMRLYYGGTVDEVTIIPSTSGAGGITFSRPENTSGLRSKRELEEEIHVLYGGRAAEEILTGDSDEVTTGASNDIEKVTEILYSMIASYGMGSGLINLDKIGLNGKDIKDDLVRLSSEYYNETLEVLKSMESDLDKVALALKDKLTLTGRELDEILIESEQA